MYLFLKYSTTYTYVSTKNIYKRKQNKLLHYHPRSITLSVGFFLNEITYILSKG